MKKTQSFLFTICLVVMVSCGLLMIKPVVANAGNVRCKVAIDLVGATDSTTNYSGDVFLAHKVGGTCPNWGTNTQNNFALTSTNGDAMLATLLTAFSLGKDVYIHSLTDEFGNWSLIHQVYVAP